MRCRHKVFDVLGKESGCESRFAVLTEIPLKAQVILPGTEGIEFRIAPLESIVRAVHGQIIQTDHEARLDLADFRAGHCAADGTANEEVRVLILREGDVEARQNIGVIAFQ